MKKYKVDILPTAVRDIINIRAYIVGRYQDTYNADIVVNDIFNSINSLIFFPRRAQICLKVSGLGLRFLKAGKYTIVYFADANNAVVKVYGVLHSRRDIFKIVKDRA